MLHRLTHGALYDELHALYGEPLLLREREVDECLLLARSIHKTTLRNAELLVERSTSRLSLEAAYQALIDGRRKYPEFERTITYPTIRSLACATKRWAICVEDQERDRKRVRASFRHFGLAVQMYDDTESFLEAVSDRPYVQYWVDLGYGHGGGDVRIGRRLLELLRQRHLIKDAARSLFLYTQHAHMAFVEEERAAGHCAEVIDKSSGDCHAIMEQIASLVVEWLAKKFAVDVANPLIRAAKAK